MKKIAIAAFMLLMGTTTAYTQWQKPVGLPPIDLSNVVTWGHFLKDLEVDELKVEKKYGNSTETDQTRFVESSVTFVPSPDSIVAVYKMGVRVKPYSPERIWHYVRLAVGKKNRVVITHNGESYSVQPMLNANPTGDGRLLVGTAGKKTISLIVRRWVPINTGAAMADFLQKNVLTFVSIEDTAGTQVFAKQWPTEAQRDTTYALEKPMGSTMKATWIVRMIGEEKFQFFLTDYGDTGHNRWSVTLANGDKYWIARVDEQKLYGSRVQRNSQGEDEFFFIEISYVPKKQ